MVSTAIPGIRDVLVLGKIKQLERGEVADLIVVDAPATGHAMTFLTSASGLLDAARGGPLRSQAADVVELLSDPTRCQVILVTLPEEMPVNETIEAAYPLEDKVGMQLGPVIVNACDPVPEGLARTAEDVAATAGVALDSGHLEALEEARRFRLDRHALSAEQIERLAHELPLPHLRVPSLVADAIGPAEIDDAGRALAGRGPARGRARARAGRDRRDVTSAHRRLVRRTATVHHRLLRLGRGRQDDHLGRVRPRGGPPGRQACVVTIDPARRLANSLGVESLTNTPTEIEGDWPGELHALMLDTKGTFDDLVHRYADTTEQAEAIQVNRIYQNLTGALSGTQEYMAMEKLYELVESGRLRRGGGGHPADPQRARLPRRPPPPDPVPGEPALPGPDDAHPDVAQGHGGGRPGPAADHLQGGRGRDRAGRGGVLPGLRGHGGGIPDPGRRGAGAAGRPGHRLRAGGLAPARLGRRGRLLRREAGRAGRRCRRPWWSTGSSPASAGWTSPAHRSPLGGRPADRAGCRSRPTWPRSTAASDREEDAYADLVGQVAPAPVGRVPLLGHDVHDLDGLGARPTSCFAV